MERIEVDNYDPVSSSWDDLGNHSIYTRLIKHGIYKLLGEPKKVNAINNTKISNGTDGAVVVNTKYLTAMAQNRYYSELEDGRPVTAYTSGLTVPENALHVDSYSYLPITFITPDDVDYKELLDNWLTLNRAIDIEHCTIGSFFSALIAVSVTNPVPRWNTFASWFETGTNMIMSDSYKDALNKSNLGNAHITIIMPDEDYYNGVGVTIQSLDDISYFFRWVYDMLPTEVKDLPVSKMKHPTIDNMYWLGFYIDNLSGTFYDLTGSTNVQIAFELRV